jgi:hypothetical protein
MITSSRENDICRGLNFRNFRDRSWISDQRGSMSDRQHTFSGFNSFGLFRFRFVSVSGFGFGFRFRLLTFAFHDV